MAKFKNKPVIIDAVQWTRENEKEALNLLGGTKYYGCLYIETLEGAMFVSENDYIIRGVNGDCYPCKPDIFKQTYELAEN